MDSVVYPKDNFNFDNITLGQPSVVQGGSYFTKISNNSNTLYLQTPSCFTKQGLIISGKKAYCDLMFTNEDHEVLSWLEKLVEKTQQLIYEKRKIWFHNEMEMEDIDNAFTPPIRTYKSGKYYLLRTHIQNINNNPLQGFSCYDQNEIKIDPSELNSNNKKIIPLLEIKGIKFSARNFNFDVTIKQAMIIEEENFLDNCLIKLNTKTDEYKKKSIETFQEKENLEENLEEKYNESVKENEKQENLEEKDLQINNTVIETNGSENNIIENTINNEQDANINNNELNDNKNQDGDDEEIIDYTEKPALLNLDLEEVTIDKQEIENLDNSIAIKSPKEAFIELWKEARNKAKLARKQAIEAYLHAKKIKTEHMLENLDDDSEDEFFDEYVENLENVETDI